MTHGPARPVVLLSFDVEEFDAPLDFGRDISPEAQFEVGARGFERLLALLDELGVRATLFITAAIGRARPDLVRRAAERHEIASHGDAHRTFEIADLARSRETLQALSNQPVLGFRRARLQRTDAGAIADAGYRWDSSENPIWIPGRYNNLFEPRTIHRRGSIVEIPISASPFLRLPLFWLAMKSLPMPIIRAASRACLAHDGYLNLFWHPWELLDLRDSGLPRHVRSPDGARFVRRLADYVRWLAKRAAFESISEWLRGRGEID